MRQQKFKTSDIAGCAMCVGLYGVLLVVNVQFSDMIAGVVPFLYSMPALVAFACYPASTALACALAMAGITCLLAPVYDWLLLPMFIVAGALTGFGMRRRWPMFYTLLVCMVLLTICTYLEMTVFAAWFGYEEQSLDALDQWLSQWISLRTLLLLSSAFSGFMQSVVLVLTGLLLQIRLPRYFGSVTFTRPGRPPRWCAWAFLLSSACMGLGFGMVKYPEGIQDVLVALWLVFAMTMLYAAWVYMFASPSILVKNGKPRPAWQRMLAMLFIWLPPLHVIGMLYGAWHLLWAPKNVSFQG